MSLFQFSKGRVVVPQQRIRVRLLIEDLATGETLLERAVVSNVVIAAQIYAATAQEFMKHEKIAPTNYDEAIRLNSP